MNENPAMMIPVKPGQTPTAQDFTNAIPEPEKMRLQVQGFIQEQRKKGVKERTIRRMVMKKFDIQIVK